MLNLRDISFLKTSIQFAILIALVIACSTGGSGSQAPAINVGGDWSGTWSSTAPANGTLALHLVDHAGTLSGNITVTGSPCLTQTALTGRVSGYTVSLSANAAGDGMELSATVQQTDSDTMTGTYRAVGGDCQGDHGSFSLSRAQAPFVGPQPDAGGPPVFPGGGNGGSSVVGLGGTAGSGGRGGSGGAGGTSGAGGSGGAGVAVNATIGGECETASDCELGLNCLAATSTSYLGAGPAHGYCALDCVVDPTLCDLYPGTLCVQGATAAEAFCMEGCTRGASVAGKCHDRADVACSELSAGIAACLPTCGNDSQCPQGRFCDTVLGACLTTQPVGDPAGSPCDPAAATNTCQGGCLDLGDGFGTCSGYCVIGIDHPACGSDPTANGAGEQICLPLLADTDGYNDLGMCMQRCDTLQDCTDPTLECSVFPDVQVRTTLDAQGLCLAPVPVIPDAGSADGG